MQLSTEAQWLSVCAGRQSCGHSPGRRCGRCRTVGLATGTDCVAGLWTLDGNGDPIERHGAAIHLDTAEARNRWQRVQAFRACTDDVSSSWIGPRYIAAPA